MAKNLEEFSEELLKKWNVGKTNYRKDVESIILETAKATIEAVKPKKPDMRGCNWSLNLGEDNMCNEFDRKAKEWLGEEKG